MSEILINLEPDQYYHIYNKAVGNEKLFESDKDYLRFIDKFKKYLLNIGEIYSYCLMPNHLHILIKLKAAVELNNYFSNKIKIIHPANDYFTQNNNALSLLISQQFSNLFNSYAKYFNLSKGRSGSLFKRAFRRKAITDEIYLKLAICYIHQNPVKAGLCKQASGWKYSSFNTINDFGETIINREEVLTLFETRNNFNFCNSIPIDLDCFAFLS